MWTVETVDTLWSSCAPVSRADFCELGRSPFSRHWLSMNEEVDELAAAAAVEAVSVLDEDGDVMMSEPTNSSVESSELQLCQSESISVDKENGGNERRSSKVRSGVSEPMLQENKLRNQAQSDDNHPKKNDNRCPLWQDDDPVIDLTIDLVRQRAADLFPDGASTPAVKPKQPAVIEKATNKLISLCFEASKKVKRVRGKLAGEEIAGYLVADYLGIELLVPEALPLGESVRKAALAAKEREKELKNGASAVKSKLRKTAEKNPARAASLEADVRRIDTTLAADLAQLWCDEPTLNGLPSERTAIVEERALADVAQRRLALRRMFPSEEAWNAIDAAEFVEDAERLFTDAKILGYEVDDEDEEKRELAMVRYKHALRRLKKAFPHVLNDCSDEGECEHRRPCPCGRGWRGAWPWVLQTPARGFCEQSEETRHENTPAGLYPCHQIHGERQRWLGAYSWSDPAERARRLPNGKPHMTEAQYKARLEAQRRVLY